MGGREREFPIGNYPPGVKGNEVEIVGENKYLCNAPACEDEIGEDFEMCVRHTAQSFWHEMCAMPPENQSQIIAELRELMALQRALETKARG